MVVWLDLRGRTTRLRSQACWHGVSGQRTSRSEAPSLVVGLLFHRTRILSQQICIFIRFVKRSFRSPSRPTCAWSSVERSVCAGRVVSIQPQSKAGILGMITWGLHLLHRPHG